MRSSVLNKTEFHRDTLIKPNLVDKSLRANFIVPNSLSVKDAGLPLTILTILPLIRCNYFTKIKSHEMNPCSIMLSTMRIEKPTGITWTSNGHHLNK